MKTIAIAFACVLCASGAYAQGRKSLKDIDKELKQTKSTATAMALIESIAEAVPQTEEDVAILGRLINNHPDQGRKALSNIKDPRLVKAIMRECDRQILKFKADKDKDWKSLPQTQRQEKHAALLNSYALVSTLGNLKNKEAVPYLKQYITKEYDGVLSYSASQAIGRIAPDDPAVFRELWDKQGVRSISYSAYGKSVLKEAAQKMQDPNVPEVEKNKILGKAKISLLSGKDPEEKRLIKDVILNHPDQRLRGEASIAVVHAVANNPEESDKDFVFKWVKKEKSLAVWDAPYVMNIIWDVRFIPLLLDMLQDQSEWMPRKNVAELFGRRQIKESLPFLESCVENDKDGSVRAVCRGSYYRITGVMLAKFHPDDVKFFEDQFVAPYSINFYSKLKDTDPDKISHNALKQALDEYKRTKLGNGKGK